MLDHKGQQDLRGRKAFRAWQAPKANRGRKVYRVTRARKVRVETRATAAPKANRGRKVQRVTRARKVRLETRAIAAKVYRVKKGRRVTKVNPARRTCA